jgi:aspartokinase-like uncharacterized kinase
MSRPVVVVKVGGSLLDWPELPVRLGRYVEARSDRRLVLIVGGGRFADVLRDLDARHALGEARSHALALRVLDLTAWILADLLPGSRVVEAVESLPAAWSSGLVPILAPRRFLERDDRGESPLPHAWTTTTDAIAARVAVRLDADELALLKSAPLPTGVDRSKAAALGLVDAEFPRASAGVPRVVYHDFRSTERIVPM